ncbi:hypothetical protein G9A89_001571 [Geosiphon pyriformis]|nr:hypothetical protein G9A89_001571 [Geosiphon pyriformis]
MHLEAVSNGDMSKKKASKNAFYGPAGGFFLQKKKVVFKNIKHSGNEKNIFLNKSEPDDNVFSDMDSLFGDKENANITGINVGSLLDLAANTSKAKCINTGAVFSSFLGSPNFVIDNDEEIEVAVKKSFALNINISAMEGKSTIAKTQVIRKLFLIINGFEEATTPSKFEEIIQLIFTSKISIEKATLLARKNGIIVNIDLKKQKVYSNQAVVIKKIFIDMPKEMIITAFSEFGQVVVLLFTLPIGTTIYDLETLLEKAGGKTCVINCFLITGNWFHFTIDLVCCERYGHFGHSVFECDSSNVLVSSFQRSYKRVVLKETCLQLARLYAKKCVVLLESALGGSSLGFGSSSGFGSLSTGISGLGGNPLLVLANNSALNGWLASLEYFLELLVDQISGIVILAVSMTVSLDLGQDMVLDSSELVSSSLSHVVSNVSALGSSSSKVLTTKIGSLESKFVALETSVNLVLVKLDQLCKIAICNVCSINVLAKQDDIIYWHIINKFEEVQIFSSSLNKSFLGARMAIIMNNSLVHHVSKIEKVSGQIISVRDLFKKKLSVMILELYAGVSAETRYDQMSKINFFIAKAVNFSTFVVVGGDFNEDSTKRNASFKFYMNLRLVNSFHEHSLAKGVEKVIFVTHNLASAVAGHKIKLVSEFFDTDYKAILIAVSLSGFLDVVKFLLDRKTAGLSGIPNKLWKHDNQQVFSGLLDILNKCLRSGTVPKQ